MEEIDYMKIQCKDCDELDKEAMRCKYFDGSEERRCFINCVLGHKVEQTDKDFNSFDIKFGDEVGGNSKLKD